MSGPLGSGLGYLAQQLYGAEAGAWAWDQPWWANQQHTEEAGPYIQ